MTGMGVEVGLSGSVAAVGALGFNARGTAASRNNGVYLFKLEGNNWNEFAKLTPHAPPEGDYLFGHQLALDWDTLLSAQAEFPSSLDENEHWQVLVYDFGVPPFTVNFDLNSRATRVGGGLLMQSVKYGEAAEAPQMEVASGWLFNAGDNVYEEVFSDLSVTALLYDSTDTDADGLWDGWELKYFGNLTISERSSNSNRNGDALSDLNEFLAGTHPLEGNSTFEVLDIRFTENILTLRFASNNDLGNRRYSILYKENFNSDEWLALPGGTFRPDAGSSTERSFPAPASEPSCFFTVKAFLLND